MIVYGVLILLANGPLVAVLAWWQRHAAYLKLVEKAFDKTGDVSLVIEAGRQLWPWPRMSRRRPDG